MALFSRRKPKPSDPLKSGKHAFVSYRTASKVTISRAIAEHLMNRGFPVWFNEYQILGKEDWGEFHPLMRSGLEKSGKALLIRDSAYHDSKYCDEEYSHFLENLDSSQVLEIALPQPVSPEPQRAWPWHYFENVNFSQITDYIDRTWRVRGHDPWSTCPPLPPHIPNWIKLPLVNIAFDLGGWEDVEVYSTPSSAANNLPQRSFVLRIGSVRFKMHIAVNPSNGLDYRFKQGDNIDDREVFKQNLGYVRTHMSSMNQFDCTYELLGNHLVFASGLNHFAFTYGFSKPSAGIWYIVLRKCVLTFPCQGRQGDMEVVITCGIDDMPEYNLRDFVAFACVFDRVVLSASPA